MGSSLPGRRIIDSIVIRPCQLGTIRTASLGTIQTCKVGTQLNIICIWAVVYTQNITVQCTVTATHTLSNSPNYWCCLCLFKILPYFQTLYQTRSCTKYCLSNYHQAYYAVCICCRNWQLGFLEMLICTRRSRTASWVWHHTCSGIWSSAMLSLFCWSIDQIDWSKF